jgi:hypothetical protein
MQFLKNIKIQAGEITEKEVQKLPMLFLEASFFCFWDSGMDSFSFWLLLCWLREFKNFFLHFFFKKKLLLPKQKKNIKKL